MSPGNSKQITLARLSVLAALLMIASVWFLRDPSISQAQSTTVLNFESPQVHPLALTPDGTRLTETETGHSAWRELQGHASMPADRTTVTEEEIEIPAGRFACLRYTRTDEDGVGTFWFAKSAPGMPLKFEKQVEGKTVFSSTTLSDETPDRVDGDF